MRVHIKVIEGESERVQIFEGTVISRRGRGDSQSFTVRKISFGVGVERTFPLNSPHVDRIEIVKAGRVRRARLYYLRGLTGRAARLAEEDSREKGSGGSSSAPAGGAESAKPSADGSASAKTGEHHKKRADSASTPAKGTNEPRALGATNP